MHPLVDLRRKLDYQDVHERELLLEPRVHGKNQGSYLPSGTSAR